MSIKIYIHYNEPGHPEKTSKLSIPGSWQSKSVSDVINLFCKPYNEKNPEHALNLEDIHLTNSEKQSIFSNSTVVEALGDHGDYYIKHGAFLKESIASSKEKETRPRCKNYGCNKYFSEEENTDDCCKHHTGPPIFHDTMKCWSCCRDRKAFDFEGFQEILGCTSGRHSVIGPIIDIAPSPNAPSTCSDESSSFKPATAAPVLKSIAAYNSENTNAVTAASAAVKTITTRKSTRKADGTARCLRAGCQKTFNFTDNLAEGNDNDNSCVYHRGQAVFHDVAKFWSCCPDRKHHDFDAFLAVPGCCRGRHDDGEIELENNNSA